MKNKKRKPARITTARAAPKPRKIVNRDGQAKRTTQLNERARLKGWNNISEYLTAVLYNDAEIPAKI